MSFSLELIFYNINNSYVTQIDKRKVILKQTVLALYLYIYGEKLRFEAAAVWAFITVCSTIFIVRFRQVLVLVLKFAWCE